MQPQSQPQSQRRKKLLIYAHYYYPDVASTGQILKELAEGLSGVFDVTVVCAVPSYTGEIPPEYKNKKFYFEQLNGVKIVRIGVPPFQKGNKISRIKNLLTYFFRAREATKMLEKHDYVFAISQPPVLGGMLGVYGKKKHKAKLIYNVQDFNPEQIEAVGYFKIKPLLALLKYLDKRTCEKADKVIVVGRDMVATLENRFKGQKARLPKVSVVNNWIDEKEIYPLSETDEGVRSFKEKYGLQNKFVIMYSGNLGLYYDLCNLLTLTEPYKNRSDVVFAFVGQGAVEEKLKNYAKEKGLENVVFIPYQKKEQLLYSLNAASAHWVVNAKGIKGVSVPSKLYGVMAVGKPVLGVLEENSEARLIVEKSGCGLVAEPQNYQKIAENLQKFIDGQADIQEMGKAGREYLEKYLTKKISLQKYVQEIKEC